MNEKFLKGIVRKNYNDKLEEIIAQKDFSEETKNILLSMFYKIENGYNDYKTIKRNTFDKSKYIRNLSNTIKNECDKIELINVNEKRKSKIDKIEHTILCKPIEKEMLYCIAKLQNKDLIVDFEDKEIGKAFSELLKQGNNINVGEPLRDFNGYSWNIVEKDIEDLECNLIYQNMIYLVGNELLDEWINSDSSKEFFEIFQKNVEEKYGKQLKEKIVFGILKLAIMINCKKDKKFTEYIFSIKDLSQQEYEKYKDKTKFLIDISEVKKEKEDKIKQLDRIINDKKLLMKEYEDRNKDLPLEKKIFSIRVLKNLLKEERINVLKEIKIINEKMKPSAFLASKKMAERKVECLNIENKENLEDETYINLIELQKNIISCINLDIKNAEDKNSIIEIIYKFRYYNYLPIEQGMDIQNTSELNLKLQRMERNLIQKAIYLKTIVKILNDDNANYNIVKNIINSKIINFEDIYLKINIAPNNEYIITIYDGDFVYKRFKIKNIEKENLQIKINKKIKLFNMDKKK